MRRKLGCFESAQAITSDYYPFNVVTVLGLGGGPAPGILSQALAILRDRHPLLRARVVRDGAHLEFELDEGLQIPLKVVPRSSAEAWQVVAEQELNTRLDPAADPLFRVTYLESTAGSASELIITAQHSIFDAVSGTHLIGEVLSLCQQLADGYSPGGFEPLPLMAAAEQYFPAPFRGWRGTWRETVFAVREIMQETAYRWRNRGPGLPPVAPSGRCRIYPVQLTETATKNLAWRCRRERVTINSVLCAAQLLVAGKRMPGHAVLRHFVFADLRPYLNPSLAPEHLGSYFAMLPITTDTGQRDLWDLARTLSRQVHKASKRGDKFTSLRLSGTLIGMLFRFKKFRMGDAALAYGGGVRLAEHYGDIHVTGLNAFVSNFVLGPPYTANARRFLGKLWWDMVYLDSDMDADAAADVAKGIIELLRPNGG